MARRRRPAAPANVSQTRQYREPSMADDGLMKTRAVVKVRHPRLMKKRIKPHVLCINRKTGCLDVAPEFFSRVWDEHETDDSWHAWVCIEEDEVIGFIVLQVFVHDSMYFAWGAPLKKKSDKPDPTTGAISNIGEISCFCAKGCGTQLLEEALTWAANNSDFEYVVLNSTEGAADWYRSKGFMDVKAYRLPPPYSQYKYARRYKAHLYRHRLGDDQIDVTVDEPSIMLYIDLTQFKHKPGEESEKEEGDDGECTLYAPTEDSLLKLRSHNITR